jgi:hypothetical protein
MSHTYARRNRHPYKRHHYALRTRLQPTLHSRVCELCGTALGRKQYYNELYAIICRACFVKEARMPERSTTDLTAFCTSHPSANEVTAALAPLGFILAFQMKADTDHAYLDLAPLPAQFHYRDSHGTEVIYLDGIDQEDERPAPQHASRFWVYAGADESAREQTAQALTTTWALTWLSLDELTIENQPALDAVA